MNSPGVHHLTVTAEICFDLIADGPEDAVEKASTMVREDLADVGYGDVAIAHVLAQHE